MLEMVAAGHGFHPCLSSFLRKPFVKFCRGAGGAGFVVGLFFSFVSFLVQMDIFFLRTKEKMCVCVCVCVSGRAFVYSFVSSLVTAGQGR